MRRFSFGMLASLGLMSSMMVGQGYAASIEDAIPLDSPCQDMAANWKGEVGMMRASAMPIKIMNTSDLSKFYALVSGDIPPVEIPRPSQAFAKQEPKFVNGRIWMVVAMYDAPGQRVDPDTSDYQIQILAQAGTGKGAKCVEMIPNARYEPYVVNHNALKPVVAADI